MKQPKVSVIIPSYNSKNFYKTFLDSLRNLDYDNCDFIIVDDNSNDGSYKEMKKRYKDDKRFKFYQPIKNLGIAGSRNFGISVSKGKYLAFAEMDMEVDKMWLKEMVKILEDKTTLAGATPKVIDFHKRNLIQTAGIKIIPQTGWVKCIGFGEASDKYNKQFFCSLGGVGSIVKRKYVTKIRGFDEMLVRNVEDVDFGWRLWIAGAKIKYTPNSIVYHWSAKPWSQRKGTLSKIEQEFHLSKVPRLMIVNYEKGMLIKNLPILIAVMAARILINILKGNLIPLLGGIKSLIWNIKMLPNTINSRNEVQKSRKVSDEYLSGKCYEKSTIYTIYIKTINPMLKKSRIWHLN